MSEIIIREYTEKDLPEMVRVWNEIIEAGIYFDYDEIMTVDYVRGWFAEQTAAVVAERSDGHICGMYILHPNGRGRCSHIANASYAVEEASRGQHIGEMMVRDSIERAKSCGFQDSAVQLRGRGQYGRARAVCKTGFYADRYDPGRAADQRRELCEYVPVLYRAVMRAA